MGGLSHEARGSPTELWQGLGFPPLGCLHFRGACGVDSPREATQSNSKVPGFQQLDPPDPGLNPNGGVWPMNSESLPVGLWWRGSWRLQG